jgi:DNA-directed RNA polymerase subunit F
MIKNDKPLSMAEAMEYGKKDEAGKEVVGFIKKFTKLKPAEAKKLRGKLQELDLIKLNEKHIVKLVDFLPDDSEEVNKIVVDSNLNEDEIKKILETIKEFK